MKTSLCFVLALAAASHQVDLTLSGRRFDSEIEVTCPNLLPGVCCQSPTNTGYVFTDITFQHLLPADIAAVWRPQVRYNHPVSPTRAWAINGCSGLVGDSRSGPGEWAWRASGRRLRATGASYIRLPTDVPPGPQFINSLSIQGILGLAWGGGEWFVSDKANRLLTGPGGHFHARYRPTGYPVRE